MADSEREQFFPTTPFTPTFGLFTPEVDAFRNLAAAAALGESEGAFEEAEDRFADISSKVAGIRDLPESEQVDATAKLLRDENLSSHVIGQILGVSNAVIENILNQNNYDLRGNPIKEEVVNLDEITTDPDPLLTIDPSLASEAAGILTVLAGSGSNNQAGAFDGNGPAAGTGSAQQGTTGVGDLGDVLSGDDVVTPTNNTEPKVTGRRTEPKVEVATETIPPSTTPTVSTGIVLDQTSTGDVKVDDQPKGFLTGMTPQARAIINEGNRSDITERMLGTFIAKQDVPIISPLQFELDNVKQSPLSTALLFSNGLMGSFV